MGPCRDKKMPHCWLWKWEEAIRQRMWQPLEGKKMDSPQSVQNKVLPTPWTVSDFWPLKLQGVINMCWGFFFNRCCFKPPKLWQFVTAAVKFATYVQQRTCIQNMIKKVFYFNYKTNNKKGKRFVAILHNRMANKHMKKYSMNTWKNSRQENV